MNSDSPTPTSGSAGVAVNEAIEALSIDGLRLTGEQRRTLAAPAHARAVFSDHPAVGLGARRDTPAGPATVTNFGTPLPTRVPASDPETTAALPVLLLETAHAQQYVNTDGTRAELQVQAACLDGFTLWTDVALLQRVPGWALRRRGADQLELHSPRGLWSHTALRPDPAWLSEAASGHDVLVIYGPAVGVVAAPGHTEPTDTGRRDELEQFRRIGYVAAGIVEYQP